MTVSKRGVGSSSVGWEGLIDKLSLVVLVALTLLNGTAAWAGVAPVALRSSLAEIETGETSNEHQ